MSTRHGLWDADFYPHPYEMGTAKTHGAMPPHLNCDPHKQLLRQFTFCAGDRSAPVLFGLVMLTVRRVCQADAVFMPSCLVWDIDISRIVVESGELFLLF